MKNGNNRNNVNIFDTSFNTTNKNDTDIDSLCRFERVETFELTPNLNNDKSLIEKSFHYTKNNLNSNNLKVVKKNKVNTKIINDSINKNKSISKSKASFQNKKSNRFSFNDVNSFNEYMKENSFKNKILIKDEHQVQNKESYYNYNQINDSINEDKIKPKKSQSKSNKELLSEYNFVKGITKKKEIGNKYGLKSKNVFESNKNNIDKKKKPSLPNFKVRKNTVSSKQKKQSNYNSLNASDILMNAKYDNKKQHGFKPRLLNSSLSQSQSRLDSSFKTKIIKSSNIPVLTDLKEIKRYISSETFDKYSLNSFLTKNTRKSLNSQRSYKSTNSNNVKKHFSPTLKSYISEKSKFTKVPCLYTLKVE